jgi:PKD repeat protein
VATKSGTTYAWSWGDGATGTGKAVGHTYDAAGTYSVRLTVTNPNGAKSSDSTSVTVQ